MRSKSKRIVQYGQKVTSAVLSPHPSKIKDFCHLPLEGSEGSAAGGGRSDLSEWQRSVSDAGVCAKESTGHRNRKGFVKSHCLILLFDDGRLF